MRSPDNTRTEDALEEARACLKEIKERGALEPDEGYADAGAAREEAAAMYEIVFNATISDEARDRLLQRCDEATPSRGSRPSTRRRDYWIVWVVARLVEEHGLAPTRSRASADKDSGLSACAAVAQALGELGININEFSVNVIWSRRDKLQAPGEQLPAWWYLSPKTARYMATLLKRSRSPV